MRHNQFRIYGLIVLLFFCISAGGQNIFVLQKAGGAGMHMFRAGDFVKLKIRSSDTTVKGMINFIYDSSLVVNYGTEVLINDIAVIYRERRMLKLLQNVCLASGLLYLSISTLNGIINNDSPIVPGETLKISGGLVLTGVILTTVTSRAHRIEPTKWKVKILDFTD